MAKRKRLNVPALTPTEPAGSEGDTPARTSRPPISQVAGDAAAQSALDALVQEVDAARREGRMVQALPLDTVDAGHLVRDRMALAEEDMTKLKTSLQARGQQAPIEVVQTEPGRYGLISGFRRLMALRMLFEETQDVRFATVRALVQPARSVSDSYVAMVEENEVRANLSFYERARLAREAVRLGIYPTPRTAVQTLFSAASPARRSKILSFVRLDDALGAYLQFPAAIPERLGLALVSRIDADQDRFLKRLCDLLRKQKADNADGERAVLERALKRVAAPTATEGSPPASSSLRKTAEATGGEDLVPGIRLTEKSERVILEGAGVTQSLMKDLRTWLLQR